MFADAEAFQLNSTKCCASGAKTVTFATALSDRSALLVAFNITIVVAFTPGAVNSPEEVTAPSVADQVIPGLVVPETIAANCWLSPDLIVTIAGLMETGPRGVVIAG